MRPCASHRQNKTRRRPAPPGPPAARAEASAGFSLLELTVALAMIGLIASAAFGGVRLGTRAWERGEAVTQAMVETRLAQGVIRRHLAAAYPLPIKPQAGDRRVDFDGASDRVGFLTPVAAHLGSGGLHRMTLGFEEDADGGRLVLRRRLQTTTEEISDGADPRGPATVLTAGVAGIAFAYYGPTRRGTPPVWQDTWQERERLPMLVRLEVEHLDHRRTDWPPLIVAPRIDMDARCVLDATDGGCRQP